MRERERERERERGGEVFDDMAVRLCNLVSWPEKEVFITK